jgi:hypothetical protein
MTQSTLQANPQRHTNLNMAKRPSKRGSAKKPRQDTASTHADSQDHRDTDQEPTIMSTSPTVPPALTTRKAVTPQGWIPQSPKAQVQGQGATDTPTSTDTAATTGKRKVRDGDQAAMNRVPDDDSKAKKSRDHSQHNVIPTGGHVTTKANPRGSDGLRRRPHRFQR